MKMKQAIVVAIVAMDNEISSKGPHAEHAQKAVNRLRVISEADAEAVKLNLQPGYGAALVLKDFLALTSWWTGRPAERVRAIFEWYIAAHS